MQHRAFCSPHRMKGTMTAAVSWALPPPPHQLLCNASLFLDLDGTLVEIVSRPEDVVVHESVIELLDGLLRQLDGRVVVVSGRPAREVRRLLRRTSTVIVGSHGAEVLLGDGVEKRASSHVPGDHVVASLRQLAVAHPGVLIENKPFGLAIHYRLAPNAEQDCHDLAERIAAQEGLDVQHGKMVVELKSHSLTKGDAVRAFMAAEPMRNGRPLFMGDDLTDEAGFAAAAEGGGAGILVGPSRATNASYRIPDVGAALRWLGEATGERHAS